MSSCYLFLECDNIFIKYLIHHVKISILLIDKFDKNKIPNNLLLTIQSLYKFSEQKLILLLMLHKSDISNMLNSSKEEFIDNNPLTNPTNLEYYFSNQCIKKYFNCNKNLSSSCCDKSIEELFTKPNCSDKNIIIKSNLDLKELIELLIINSKILIDICKNKKSSNPLIISLCVEIITKLESDILKLYHCNP
ncbi:MAG: hypothetical protein RLZZ546_2474 [Bacteroidota bacterium]|jgi:hypothetical protein